MNGVHFSAIYIKIEKVTPNMQPRLKKRPHHDCLINFNISKGNDFQCGHCYLS